MTTNDDPPKSPLKRGTLRKSPVPPLKRGARGDQPTVVSISRIGINYILAKFTEK